MMKCRITVMKTVFHEDLKLRYENPIEHACDMKVGMTFVSENCQRPEGLCESAWEVMRPFVENLSKGEKEIYEGWMKDPRTAMISCNDGFRPVSFLLEAIDVHSE